MLLPERCSEYFHFRSEQAPTSTMKVSALIATTLALVSSTYASPAVHPRSAAAPSASGFPGLMGELTKWVEIIEIAVFTKTCKEKHRLEGADIMNINFQCELVNGRMISTTSQAGASPLVTSIHTGTSVTNLGSRTIHAPTGELIATTIQPSAVYNYGICSCGGPAASSSGFASAATHVPRRVKRA